MNIKLANYFREHVQRVFSFLVSEYGFEPPVLVIDDRIHFAFVTYMGKNLAIELILDEREEDVDCKIARVLEGQKTHHYERDDEGVLVRTGLYTLLVARGLPEQFFRGVGGLDLCARIPRMLEDFATMLRKHSQEILRDSPSALSEPQDAKRPSRDPELWRLWEQRQHAGPASSERPTLESVRAEVDQAWRAKNFGRVIELLEPLADDLPQVEVEKLAYARKHSQ